MPDDLLQQALPGRGPQSDAERLAWLRLARSHRVGPVTFMRLLREHGSVFDALAALPEVARDAGVNSYTACSEADATREMAAGEKAGARLLFRGAPDYPPRLNDVSDAPPLLWSRGNVALAARGNVALVGARNASSLGRRMAGLLAAELGKAGVVVTSGMARGIDAAAHKAALTSGTIAVLAGGVDTVYPTENAALYGQILESGLILSEMPPGTRPQARHFPRRNRIISGVAAGVVVIEGASRSGSLITARDALDQGREVMAVPGTPLDARAAGCNMLIRDGAVLVRSGADIIEALGTAQSRPERPPAPPMPLDQPARADNLTGRIMALLGPDPISEDSIIRDLNAPANQVLDAFIDLELAGNLARHAGGMISAPQGD